MINVLIIHFNTPELTRACVLSILKHTPNCNITVFDNSTTRPFKPTNGVRVIDNTKGQEIDFNKFINIFQNRRKSDNGYGSAKHCYSVNYCFKYFNDGFILLDSDVLVKRDLSELWNSKIIWSGQPHISGKHPVNIERLYPFCCYINVAMCRKLGIQYFDKNHMWQLSEGRGSWYDTGAWFLEATKGIPSRTIKIKDYITHYGGGSFLKNKPETPEEWLSNNAKYYQ